MLSVIGDGVGSYSVVQAGLEFPEYDKQATDSWQSFLSTSLGADVTDGSCHDCLLERDGRDRV